MKSSPILTKAAPMVALEERHSLETRIRHDLMAHAELRFSSLVVHRIPDGVCLEGVVSTCTDDVPVSDLVKEIAGVNEVINHLVVCPDMQPSKG